MTAWEALKDAPRRIGEAAQAGPVLRAIASPPRRLSRAPFAVLVVALLVGGMVGLLLLNTQLQNQAFAVRDAQRAANELGYRVSDLESQVTRAQSPINLGREASELGMVPNPYAVFIDLETGQVVGEPVAVTGEEIPSLRQQATPEVPPVGEGAAAATPTDPLDPAAAVPPADPAATPGEEASTDGAAADGEAAAEGGAAAEDGGDAEAAGDASTEPTSDATPGATP